MLFPCETTLTPLWPFLMILKRFHHGVFLAFDVFNGIRPNPGRWMR